MQLKPSQELIHNSGGPSRDPNLYDLTTWPEYQFVNDPASGGSEMLDPSSLVEWSAMEEEGLKAFYLVLASGAGPGAGLEVCLMYILPEFTLNGVL